MLTIPEIIFYKVAKVVTSVLYPLVLLKKSILASNTCVILAYHNVSHLKIQRKKAIHDNVSLSSFKKQMNYLSLKRYNVLKLVDFIILCKNKNQIPNKSVIITFDDGYKNIYRTAYPILKELNFPATIFLTTQYVGKMEIFPWLRVKKNTVCHVENNRTDWLPLSWAEVTEMSRNGISFGSHTVTHPELGTLSGRQIEREINESKLVIEKNTGKRVSSFAYPHSLMSGKLVDKKSLENVKKILKENGFEAACSTEIGTNSPNNDLFVLKRVQIDETDTFFHFKAKAIGAYNWVGFAQKIFRKIYILKYRFGTLKDIPGV